MKRFAATLLSLFCFAAALPFTGRAQVVSSPEAPAVTIARKGSQAPQPGTAEYFTGSVTVEPVFAAKAPSHVSGSSVTFQPGARSAWHTHPFGQMLIVTAGDGWIQSWGGPIQEMHAGDVVRIPPGVKHWHGASATSSVTHLAILEELDGKNVNWLEKVSDEQYRPGPVTTAEPQKPKE